MNEIRIDPRGTRFEAMDYLSAYDDGGETVKIVYGCVSSHPWKDRVYPPSIITVSRSEFEEILAGSGAAANARKAKDDAQQAREDARASWIATLPDTIGELVVNKRSGELEDPYGNYICSLPLCEPSEGFATWAARKERESLECDD